MKLFAPVDMTQGSPVKCIVQFTVPMLIGNVAQQLYNTADSVIVGKYVGDNALAAVGSAGPVFNLLLVLMVGISVGAGIVVAQYFGARKREELSRAIGACITLTILASLILMVVAPLVVQPLLRFLKTPDSILGWCNKYLLILFLGVLGPAFYNILSGILRGLGDSVSALIYLLVSTVLNIVLDWLFVAKLGMEGVSGVAYATVIAQFISAGLALRKLSTLTDIFDLKVKYLKPDKFHIGQIIRLGVPSGITQLIFSLSTIIVQQLTNSFGEMFIAANVIVMRIDGFVMMPAFSFGGAMTTFAGQNIGAGRMDRLQEGSRKGTLVAMATSAVLAVLIFLFGRYLMMLFTDTMELVDYSFSMMKILMVGYICMEVTQCLGGVMRGAGDTVTPMIISMVTTVGIRMPLAYLLEYVTREPGASRGNPACIFWSLLITWVLGALITFVCYRTGVWKKRMSKMGVNA